jgi:cardiolipin synthase
VSWTIIGLGFIVWFVLVLFFTPRIDYNVSHPTRRNSDEFLHVLQATCQAAIHFDNKVEILTNGAQFYPAMRDAILAAESSVNMEAYIFEQGEAAKMLVEAMVDRARAGVEVRLTLDWVGSLMMVFGTPLRQLREAGCQVQFYQGLRWYRFHRMNNRTHRELLVIDGRVAFTGGAGVADQWLHRGPDRGGVARSLRRELARVLR